MEQLKYEVYVWKNGPVGKPWTTNWYWLALLYSLVMGWPAKMTVIRWRT